MSVLVNNSKTAKFSLSTEYPQERYSVDVFLIHRSLKKFPESVNFIKMNDIIWDILVSGVGSIHKLPSEQVLSS
jgi:hypothetical protein